MIEADLPREAVNPVVDDLMALGVQDRGHDPAHPGHDLDLAAAACRPSSAAPGASADAVVWTDVIERAYEESALTWTYLSFMILATLLAAIAIVTDSVILVIGAMVLGPEFVADRRPGRRASCAVAATCSVRRCGPSSSASRVSIASSRR